MNSVAYRWKGFVVSSLLARWPLQCLDSLLASSKSLDQFHCSQDYSTKGISVGKGTYTGRDYFTNSNPFHNIIPCTYVSSKYKPLPVYFSITELTSSVFNDKWICKIPSGFIYTVSKLIMY